MALMRGLLVVSNELIVQELNEHLNEGCIDSRCSFVVKDGEASFDRSFVEHLVEVILDTLEES